MIPETPPNALSWLLIGGVLMIAFGVVGAAIDALDRILNKGKGRPESRP